MSDFVAGWMGGVSVLLVGHPFDTLKVWQQSRNAIGASFTTAPKENSVAAAMELYQTNGLRAFYKGLCAPMCAVGFANSALFGMYGVVVNFLVRNDSTQFYYYNDEYQKDMTQMNPNSNVYKTGDPSHQKQDLSEHFRTGGGLSAFENFMASTAGGVAYATIMNPFELVKIRLQTERLFPHRKYLGTVHCARSLYKDGGIRYFFKGYSATLIRDIPGAGVYLFSYSTFIQLLGSEKNYSIPYILLAGGCAGVAQWIVVFPLDTIKTRIQVAKRGKEQGWTWCARQLYNKHGFTGLYRGVTPALVRAFAANAAAFVGVEATLEFFRTTGLEDLDEMDS